MTERRLAQIQDSLWRLLGISGRTENECPKTKVFLESVQELIVEFRKERQFREVAQHCANEFSNRVLELATENVELKRRLDAYESKRRIS